jgi:hypothetical protein
MTVAEFAAFRELMYELASGDDDRIHRALDGWTVEDIARLRVVVEKLARRLGERRLPPLAIFVPVEPPVWS